MSWQNIVQPPIPNESTRFRRPRQARGTEKFERLLDAAHQLVDADGLGNFGIRDVAATARISAGSAYHFFPNIDSLLVALVERYDKEFVRIVSEPVDSDAVPTWREQLSRHFENARRYINGNRPALTLIVGPGRSWQLRQADTVGNAEIAAAIVSSLSERFILPGKPPPKELLQIGIRQLESLWELSVQQHGHVTEAFAAEATLAVTAYLSQYWPPFLEGIR